MYSTNRYTFFKEINTSKNILEIGKLHAPIFKSSKNLDVFSKEQLVEHYKDDANLNVNNISDVDYVIKDNDWSDVPPDFDYVVTSHNMEHVPCLVTFLNNIHDSLKPEGLVFIAIPDYRYCFDRHKLPSNIIDVLDAFYSKRTKPSVRNILEQCLISSHNNAIQYWASDYQLTDDAYNKIDVEKCKGLINLNFDTYIDSHCWKFTPDNFQYIINTLNELGLIKLKINKIYTTERNSHEFYIKLSK